jgi:hypothetical protein
MTLPNAMSSYLWHRYDKVRVMSDFDPSAMDAQLVEQLSILRKVDPLIGFFDPGRAS